MAEGPRDIHDSGFKLLFDHADMVRDLLRGFVPADIVGDFDFASLEPFPTDHVGNDLRQSRSDRVWRVRFRAAGSQEWLYLLLLLEFQSTADRYMAVRVLSYTAQTWLKLIRSGDLMSDGRLPPVLPMVVYNGSPRWSAPLEVREAVAEVGPGLAPFQPRQRYLLLDQGALDVETLPPGNLVSAQVWLGSRAGSGCACGIGPHRGVAVGTASREPPSGFCGDGASAGEPEPDSGVAGRPGGESAGVGASGGFERDGIDAWGTHRRICRGESCGESRGETQASPCTGPCTGS